MCVGDKRPVTASLREYVCIWAPIVKQTDIQIRMINCADLNLSILTLAAYFRRAVTHSLQLLAELRVAGARVNIPSVEKKKEIHADRSATKFLRVKETQRKTDRR